MIAAIIIAAALIWGITQYNGLVRLRALAEEAYSGMDVYLKKRADLIPNLVEAVRGYMTHEEDTLTKVIELRNAAMSSDRNASADAQNALSEGISKIFALAENYPALKADTQFTSLQNSLRSVEEDIAQARKYYNGAVRQFNTKVRSFPASLIASAKGFYEYPYYEAAAEDRENVKVSL